MRQKIDFVQEHLCNMTISQQQLVKISKDIYNTYDRAEYTEQQKREQMEAATYGYNLGFEMALDLIIKHIQKEQKANGKNQRSGNAKGIGKQ